MKRHESLGAVTHTHTHTHTHKYLTKDTSFLYPKIKNKSRESI